MTAIKPIRIFAICSLLFSSFCQANDDYEKAVLALSQTQVEAAFIHVKNALKVEPNNLSARILYGSILNEKLQYEEAEAEMRQALAQGADRNLVVEVIGVSLLKQGFYDELLNLFSESDLTGSALVQYRLMKASAHLAKGDVALALRGYQTLQAEYPENIDVQLGLASTYIMTVELEPAVNIITKLAHKYPNDPRILRYQGTILNNQGRYEEALSKFQQALKLEPSSALSLRGVVNAHISLQQFELAQTQVNKLIELTPYDPQARLLSSIILKGLEKDQAAMAVLKEITDELSSLDQTFMLSQPQLLLIDAMASYNLNNWEQALKKFTRYLRHDTGEVEVRAVVLLADVYKRIGKYTDAMEVLAKYQRQLIQNKDYALLLANMYIQYGKHLDAQDALAMLRDVYGDDSDIVFLEAHLLAKRNNIKQAIERLRSVELKDDNNYLHTLAVLLLKDGQAEEAKKLTAKLLAGQPDNEEYQLLNVNIQLATGDIKAAIAQIENMYQLQPENARVKTEYAKILWSRSRHASARKLLRELTQSYPDEASYKLLLAEVEYSMRNISSAVALLRPLTLDNLLQTKALIKLAYIFIETNQVDDALEVTHQLLRIDALNPIAIYLHSKALVKTDNPAAANLYTKKLSVLWQDDWQNLLKLSGVQAAAKDQLGARESLLKAKSLNPNSATLMLAHTRLEIFFGFAENAKAVVGELMKMASVERSEVTYLLAEIARLEGDVEAMFSQLEATLKVDPDHISAFRNLTQIGKKRSYSDRYIKVATQLVEVRPENVLYRIALAEHLLFFKNYSLSAFHYQQALTQNLPVEQRAFALNNLAAISLKLEKIPLAVSYAEQAAELIPNHPAILDSAGWANTLNGDLAQGIYHLRQAYSLDVSSNEVIFHLAYTLKQLGRDDEARDYWRKLNNHSLLEDQVRLAWLKNAMER